MVVIGTEQRVYGTLQGGCHIWLKRFKVTYGSTIIYGDTVPIKNCGYKKKGYLSMLFFASGATLPYAVFEVRKCQSGKNYIFIETYGEVAPPSFPMTLWFNQGTETIPDWVSLRAAPHTTGIMGLEESTFKFIETKGGSVVNTISCCKKCTACGCLTCTITDRFYIKNLSTGEIVLGTATDPGECPHTSQTGAKRTGWGYQKLGEQSILFETTSSTLFTVASNGPFNVILERDPYEVWEVHYIDKDVTPNVDHILDTYTWMGNLSDCWDIVVEYTMNCSTIDIWSYTVKIPLPINLVGQTVQMTMDQYSITGDIESYDVSAKNIQLVKSSIPQASWNYGGGSNAFEIRSMPLTFKHTRTFNGMGLQLTAYGLFGDPYYFTTPTFFVPISGIMVRAKISFETDAPNSQMWNIGGSCSGNTWERTYQSSGTIDIVIDGSYIDYSANPAFIFGHQVWFTGLFNYLGNNDPTTYTMNSKIEILDIYDKYTEESYLGLLPTFNTIGMNSQGYGAGGWHGGMTLRFV